MVNSRRLILCCSVLAAPALLPASPRATEAEPALAAARDVSALVARIDERLAAGWSAAGARPAPPADDAEFMRRVSLDLAGRIPSVSEARAFLKDDSPDKRQRLVETLLDSPLYVRHFGNVWRSLLIPEAVANIQVQIQMPSFVAWLRKELHRNAGYDQVARDLLTAPLTNANPRQLLANNTVEPSPQAYYLAKEFQPENLAAGTARVFLGVRVECAQCHHHPFASWKREQFWSYAAFFAGVQRGGPQVNVRLTQPQRPEPHEIKIGGTDKVVPATFLDGGKPEWKEGLSGRAALAEWMTRADNPFFARAGVNRMWYYFFGTGLIDPVDELVGGESKESHPELLDELARGFATHQFDLKYLIRAITASKAYQLSSAATDKGQVDPHLFARMPLRGMTPEQLFDSVAEAIGYTEDVPENNALVIRLQPNTPRAQFVAKFGGQTDKATESQTSILQALSLMNGRFIADATSLDARRSPRLSAILDAPFMTTATRVETLYLATLSRKPTPREGERMIRYVETGGDVRTDQPTQEQKNAALADVYWVLLNSSEFVVNH
jgi:hypothetical protein